MSDYPTFETEKDFQMDLAADLRLLGWDKVATEYSIAGTQYAIDILAAGNSLNRGLSDKRRMTAHKVMWLNPAVFKREAKHPERRADVFLEQLEADIDAYELSARELRKTYDKLARKLEAHRSSMRLMGVITTSTKIQEALIKQLAEA